MIEYSSQKRQFVNACGALICSLLLAYALYAEYVLGFEPCPLCIFERIGVLFLGFIFLLAALHNPRSFFVNRLYAVLIALVAAFPSYVAGRHVYIQSLPPGTVPSCGASLDYMLNVFPVLTVLKKVLTGAGECARIDWVFLGLAMPAWVLISVLSLAAFGIWINTRRVSII